MAGDSIPQGWELIRLIYSSATPPLSLLLGDKAGASIMAKTAHAETTKTRNLKRRRRMRRGRR